MNVKKRETIEISTIVNASPEKTWSTWTDPIHITKWNFASDDWQTTTATNDLRPQGRFSSRMEAKDGSFGFDFGGIYTEVIPLKKIGYTLDDDRIVEISFTKKENSIEIIEVFEAESENTLEQQKYGWQCILDNFKKYTESLPD